MAGGAALTNLFSGLAGDAERIAGRAVSDGAQLAGDALDAAGLSSAARAVDTLGDKAGYALGADVPELQLGQTSEPAQLVHGDPAAIRASASRLATFRAAFGQTADGLTGLDTEHWTGRAADAFRGKFAPHPARWQEASSATGNAGGALESYADAVESAQGLARQAIDVYAAGQQATASAQAAYRQQVNAYNSAAQVYNARLADGTDPGPRPEAPAAFSDPGASLRAEAEQLLRRARAARDTAAAQAAATIKTATGAAPAEPSFWSRLAADVSDSVQAGELASVHFGGGVLTGAADIAKFGRSVDPMDPWNVTHPAEYAAGLSGTAAGLADDVINPGALAGSVLGAGWGSDPAAALGHLVPNVALAVATGGAAAGADAGAAAAADAGAAAAEDAAGSAAAGSTAGSTAAGGSLGASGDGAASGLADAAGNPAVAARSPADIPQAGDPVDVATGDVLLFQDDVSLPGALPLVIGRAYRSSRGAGRWFGPAWASTFDQRLQVSPERVIGVFADGRILSWRCRTGEDGPVPETGLPVTGPRWRLERVGAGGFTVTDPQAGLTWRFESHPGYYRSAGGLGELPLVSVTDRAGNQISFSYAPTGEPAWITHSGGYRIRVIMSGGRFTALVLASSQADDAAADSTERGDPEPDGAEPDGAVTEEAGLYGGGLDGAGLGVLLVEYRYDPAGNLAAVINSSGEPLRFSYDEHGRLLGWDDRNGISYRYSYDERGRCVAGAGPGGVMSGRFAYGDRVTWWTDAAGAVTIYQLDESSRLAAVTDPLGNVTHFWRDEYGRTVARADPLGRLTRYGYDERGNLTCITRPDGSQVSAVYDEMDQPVRLEEPDGASWEQEYDARGNLARQIAPDGAVTAYGYDERGHLASVTDPLGAMTRVESDPAGLPVAVTSPGGGTTRYTRDLFGRVTVITGPEGAVTELTWTVEGQLASRTFPDGTSERLAYDAEGNLTTRVNPAGARTSYEYGPFDLVTAATGAEGSRTEFRYDQELRLITVTRAGLTWRYSYDTAGRLLAETDYNGASTQYSYDPAGQLTGRVNAAGQHVAFAYDELGHLIKRVSGGAVTTFGYDAAGRLVLAGNPDAQIRLSRDPAGRITAETCNDRTVLLAYDRAGRRICRVTPGGSRQRWEYAEAGHPVLLEANGHVFEFGYDDAGRETRRDLPGGLSLTQDWNAAGQLTAQVLLAVPDAPDAEKAAMGAVPWVPGAQGAGSVAPGRRVLARRAYTYRADGLLEGIDDLIAGPHRFTLDEAGRVTSIKGPGWAERYDYDPAGNISSARWIAPPPSEAGAWLAADVQGPRDPAGTLITRAGTARYRHDKQGRVIQRQRARISRKPDTWIYQWDADDRLTAVATPDGSTWRYRYDPFGRRVAKQRFDPSGTLCEETTFTWDGALLAEESTQRSARQRRVTWDYRPGTCTPLTQSESVSYSAAPQEIIDARFYAIVTDQLGTPAELVSPDGAVAGYQHHTLWGGTLWHPGGASTPLRFPGQYHDQETGLHYNQQRYYDPVTGSYLTPDPLGLAPAPNPHTYVPNPHLQADPLGLMTCGPGGVAGNAVSLDSSTARALASADRSVANRVTAQIGGRQMVMSQTAASEFQGAVARLAGPTEKAFAGELMRQVHVVADNPSAEAAALRLTGRVGANDIVIFGTADRMGIPIFTSDGAFLRGAAAQGVEFNAILHPPMSLLGY
jgi:RHS repeat-associated protein